MLLENQCNDYGIGKLVWHWTENEEFCLMFASHRSLKEIHRKPLQRPWKLRSDTTMANNLDLAAVSLFHSSAPFRVTAHFLTASWLMWHTRLHWPILPCPGRSTRRSSHLGPSADCSRMNWAPRWTAVWTGSTWLQPSVRTLRRGPLQPPGRVIQGCSTFCVLPQEHQGPSWHHQSPRSGLHLQETPKTPAWMMVSDPLGVLLAPLCSSGKPSLMLTSLCPSHAVWGLPISVAKGEQVFFMPKETPAAGWRERQVFLGGKYLTMFSLHFFVMPSPDFTSPLFYNDKTNCVRNLVYRLYSAHWVFFFFFWWRGGHGDGKIEMLPSVPCFPIEMAKAMTIHMSAVVCFALSSA